MRDDSADRLRYPAGTILFARRITNATKGLVPGAKVIVRERVPNSNQTMQVLVGRLGWSPTGDLMVFTSSSNRDVSSAVPVQIVTGEGLGERASRYQPEHPEEISYIAGPNDPAELLGIVEKALTDERSRT